MKNYDLYTLNKINEFAKSKNDNTQKFIDTQRERMKQVFKNISIQRTHGNDNIRTNETRANFGV